MATLFFKWIRFFSRWISVAVFLLLCPLVVADAHALEQVSLSAEERAWLAQDPLVRIRVGHFPPLMFVDSNRVEGVAIDYLERVFLAHGIRYEYVLDTEVSWSEALDYMRRREAVDMVPTAKITEERKSYLAFTDEYLFMPWVIFTRDDASFVGGIEDLFGKTVAVPEGFVMQKLLAENYPEIKLEVIKGPGEMEKCIRSLSYGKVDALIENLTLGSYFINNYGFTNLKIAAPTPFDDHNQAMAMRSDWPELAGIINKTLRTLPQGEKTAIMNRWMSVRYEHGLNMTDVLKWVGGVSLLSMLVVAVIIGHNRSLRKEVELRRTAESRLIEANKELDAYVHTVSHDLKAPLMPITGYAELIQQQYRELIDDKALSYLQEIEDSGHRMALLVDDLLAMATVGKLEKPAALQDAVGIARKVIRDLTAKMANGCPTVELDMLPEALVHRTHLEQLFSNLIGNAMKYAGGTLAVIEVGGSREGQAVRYFVRDHGPGLPADEHDKIFDLFYRGEGDPDHPGTGIGLATVKKIAGLYTGRAWVEDTPGGGCTFFVELVDDSVA